VVRRHAITQRVEVRGSSLQIDVMAESARLEDSHVVDLVERPPLEVVLCGSLGDIQSGGHLWRDHSGLLLIF